MSNYLNEIESDLYKLNSITNGSGEVVEMVAELKEKYEKAKAFDAISYIIKKRANDDFSSVNNDYEAGILRAYEVMECNVDDFYRGDTEC